MYQQDNNEIELFSKVKRNSKLELVHYNICKINGMSIRSEKKYFIIFIDDYFCFIYIYLLRTKDDVFEKFKKIKMKIFKNNRGEKYANNASCFVINLVFPGKRTWKIRELNWIYF